MLQLFVEHGIRGVPDYAEVLVAEALHGERQRNSVNKGFDVIAPQYGRIEVKSRQLPKDGRIEERVQLSDSKENGFDYLAIVILRHDFHVKGIVLVPYAEVWCTVSKSAYNRISYSQACQCDGGIDITSLAGQS